MQQPSVGRGKSAQHQFSQRNNITVSAFNRQKSGLACLFAARCADREHRKLTIISVLGQSPHTIGTGYQKRLHIIEIKRRPLFDRVNFKERRNYRRVAPRA